jgi:hypothetical protein
MDKKILAALIVVLALIVLALVVGTYCGMPVSTNGSGGDMRMACIFPPPWSRIFGVGKQIYDFNIYVCTGLPALLLLLWFFTSFRDNK